LGEKAGAAFLARKKIDGGGRHAFQAISAKRYINSLENYPKSR
jgi:hypothetical protein